MEAGNHLDCKVVAAGLGKSPEKETPFIKITFKNQQGEMITNYFWLSDLARDKSIDTLVKLGFKGKKLSDLANDKIDIDDLFGEAQARVDLVVEKEEYTNKEGEIKSRNVVKWVNIGSGGMPELSHDKAKSIFDGEVFDGLLKEKRRLEGEPKPKKKEEKKEADNGVPADVNDDDIPF